FPARNPGPCSERGSSDPRIAGDLAGRGGPGVCGAECGADFRGNGPAQSAWGGGKACGGKTEAEMSRVLAYCGFRDRPEISLPPKGVSAAAVQVMAEAGLRLLWSEVEWPIESERMQKSAVEFHEVVHHIFRQAAVIPFRLLSVFEDEQSLAAFAAEHATAFVEDLERLKDCVQMEC